MLQQEKAKTVDRKVRASFDDLERRLDKRRTQQLEAEQQTFAQEQEALKNRAEILAPKTASADTQAPGTTETTQLPQVRI